MKRTLDYEMREVLGVGWLAHRRRVGTKVLILCAVSGFAIAAIGIVIVNPMEMICGTFLMGIAGFAAS